MMRTPSAAARAVAVLFVGAGLFAGGAFAQTPALSHGEIALGLVALDGAADHGIEVRDLAEIHRALASPNSLDVWLGQVGLQRGLAWYAAAQHGGRLGPHQAPDQWTILPPPYDGAAELAQARSGRRLESLLSGLAPTSSAYIALLERRRFYAALAAQGGWSSLQERPSLRVGDVGPRVVSLRARLAQEGYGALPEQALETFDDPLAAALSDYQGSRGIAPDGVLGAETVAALNLPVEAVLHQIDLNLERLRWLPRDLPATQVEVNIPGYELVYYENGAEALRMRTIVGMRTNRTPMMLASIEAVILNPPWLVPVSIARTEILPAARADPTYLARFGYTVTDGRVLQAPGPGNALGQVKFDAPNPSGVYLHDTPARDLFKRTDRALSHACVRLERPRELAGALLRDQGWTPESIDAAIATGATERVALTAPIPVFFLYQTASVKGERLQLFPDIYGWDAILARLIEKSRTATAQARAPSTMCAALP